MLFFVFKLAFVVKQQNWQGHSFFEKVPAFWTEDTGERRQKKKEITFVNGAGKNNPSNKI